MDRCRVCGGRQKITLPLYPHAVAEFDPSYAPMPNDTFVSSKDYPCPECAPTVPAFLEAHGGICYWCRLPITDLHDMDIEHVIARELGGSDEPENLKPIHRRVCHTAKSKLDKGLISKSNRVRRAHGLDPDTRKWKPKKITSRKQWAKGPSRWPKRKMMTRKAKR
jgi:hypothetical protein